LPASFSFHSEFETFIAYTSIKKPIAELAFAGGLELRLIS
jgi:hypothetical protein